MSDNANSDGFTIIELIMAMAFFSFVLSMIVFGFVQIVRAYRGGVVTHRTQLALREAADDISEEIRNSQSVEVVDKNNLVYLCGSRAIYIYDKSDNSLKKKDMNRDVDCNLENISSDGSHSVVPDSLMVPKFIVESQNIDGEQVGINLDLEVATNQEDLLVEDNGEKICDPSLKGSQFCEVSRLRTSIAIRYRGVE